MQLSEPVSDVDARQPGPAMRRTRSTPANTRSPLDLRLLSARATARKPAYHSSKPRRLPLPPSRSSSPSVDPTHLDPPTPTEHGARCLERAQEGAPAAVQITAEQLLREAADFQEKAAPKPKQRIEDFEELHDTSTLLTAGPAAQRLEALLAAAPQEANFAQLAGDLLIWRLPCSRLQTSLYFSVPLASLFYRSPNMRPHCDMPKDMLSFRANGLTGGEKK
ncbi:hypothetical protein RTBOTA2_002691 [Rhodotorula toruloides]|nr:hypothetical protein RTBOTA2_002691 [Rhodotorula toruloides]